MTSGPEHVALVLRTLGIDQDCWGLFMEGFAAQCPAGTKSLDHRIRTLKEIWRSLSPHEATLDKMFDYDRRCPVCGMEAVAVVAARRQEDAPPLVYGACGACGLGLLLQGGAKSSIYAQPDYYQSRDSGGAGYESYLAERAYREAKGRRLVKWIRSRTVRPLQTFLEVGSGFGFTRDGAEQLGLTTIGVDLNPYAAEVARELYGQHTFRGTLAEALESKAVTPNSHDIVFYQFVLEHLENPADELKLAARSLARRGVLALVVPNMQLPEREIFGASYRSFRHDHLWLFSSGSLKLLLERAGLWIIAIESECSTRLLRGFLTEAELNQLDAGCRSADLIVIAERKQM